LTAGGILFILFILLDFNFISGFVFGTDGRTDLFTGRTDGHLFIIYLNIYGRMDGRTFTDGTDRRMDTDGHLRTRMYLFDGQKGWMDGWIAT
jgi:hypothetical protein